MSRRLCLLCLLAVVLAAAASCSRIEEPTVVLREVKGGRLTNEGLEFDLVVDVENPNGFGAEIGRMEYEILADGTAVVEGRRAERVPVPAKGTSRVAIPFVLKWSGAGELLEAILDGDEHLWTIEGRVVLHKGPIARTFPFSESETLRAPVSAESN